MTAHPTPIPDQPPIPVVSNEGDAPPLPLPGFHELGLSDRVLQAVRAAGYEQPTPIQAQFIPRALTGCDVMGQAQTGTGKTASFLLPAFERVRHGEGNPSVLILAPTRELALQIHGEVERLGHGLGLTAITLYGGSSYDPQIAALTKGVDLVVGTPGRLMDHMRARRLNLSEVKMAVLDEADRMLDLGFRKDIEYILRHCPTERQTLLLSATIPDDILKLAKRFMREPEEIGTAPERLTVDKVEQSYFVVERDQKLPLLLKLLDEERPGLAIIFCTTKISAKKLAARLKNVHLNAREIHGDLVQAKREKIMGHFRKGKVQILVATDVASRGIDVQEITHIINYDVPYRTEDYVHRIGRTGRIGRSGKAFTFVTKDEAGFLTEIEQLINRELKFVKYETLESRFWPNPPAVPPPEFVAEDDETEVSEADYIEKRGDDRGGRRPARTGRREGGGDARGGHRSRSQAGPPRGDRPRAAGADTAVESADPSRSQRRGRRSRGEPMDITCSKCGVKTTVNFKPDPNRPVYCDACYATKKAAREAGGRPPESGSAAPIE